MEKQKNKERDAEVTKNKETQDSKTQPSTEERQNNIPQKNKVQSEESEPIEPEAVNNSSQNASEMSMAQIMDKLKDDWKDPETLSKQRENIGIKIEQVGVAINKLRDANKRISSLDKRIKTIESPESSVSSDERKLNELKIISLQTELVNLREKNEVLWERFVASFDSEKAALQFERLRSQARSKRYHRTAGYFIKKMILEVLNRIIEQDKAAIVEVKKLADATSDEGVKLFNEKVRELLYKYDDNLVIRCSYYNKEKYHSILRLTLKRWDPAAEAVINELVVPAESE